MADISVNISVSRARVSRPDEIDEPDMGGGICIYFPEPGLFLHGTPSEMREFARQIAAKVGG